MESRRTEQVLWWRGRVVTNQRGEDVEKVVGR
jgi:hypothetical protein